MANHYFPAVKYKERCLVQDDLKAKAKNIFLYNYHGQYLKKKLQKTPKQ